MKRVIVILLTGFLVLSINSCSETKDIDDNLTGLHSDTRSAIDYPEPTFDQVKRYLDNVGYNTTTLTEHDGYYLIDGDMAFETDRLAEAIAQVDTRMVVGDKKKLDKQYYRLRLSLSYDSGESVQLFHDAIAEWNNVSGSCLNFQSTLQEGYNNARQEVRFDISANPILPSGSRLTQFAYVSMPTAGKVGSVICINTAHDNWRNLPSEQKKFAIMHFLGHMVGFEHVNQMSSDTNFEFNSIMQDEAGLSDNNFLWSGFASGDIKSIQQAYPLGSPIGSVSCNPYCESNKLEKEMEYTFTPTYDYAWVYNPRYEFSVIQGAENVAFNSSSGKFSLKFIKAGVCTVKVTVFDALNEKNIDGDDYSFDVPLRSPSTEIVKIFPTTIELGKPQLFRIEIPESEKINVSFIYTIEDYYNQLVFVDPVSYDEEEVVSPAFIGPDEIPSGITYNGKMTRKYVRALDLGDGEVYITFNKHGGYKVRVVAYYNGKVASFSFLYVNLYRPQVNFRHWLATSIGGGYSLPDYSETPTGPNWVGDKRIEVHFGDANTLQEPMIVYVWDELSRDYVVPGINGEVSTTTNVVERRGGIYVWDVGATAYYYCKTRDCYYHPDSINYKQHYTYFYPTATVEYPDDFCGLKRLTFGDYVDIE